MPSPRRTILLAPLVTLLAVALAALPVLGADAPRTDPAWAKPIHDGIVTQDQDVARGGAEAVVRKLESRVGRGTTDIVTLYLMARAYGLKGDPRSAMDTYADVLKMDAGCWFAWRDRGVLKALAKDAARDARGAEADFRQAIRLRPDYVEALQPLAALLLEPAKDGAAPPKERLEEASRLLNRVLDADPTKESARLQLLDAYLALAKPDEAAAALQPLLAREPTSPGLRMQKARILVVKGDFAGAQEIYERISREYPDQTGPLRAWIGVAAKAGTIDPEKALDVLERLKRLTPVADEKKMLAKQIDDLRDRMASAGAAGGPPPAEILVRRLRDPDAKVRQQTLLLILHAAQPGAQVSGDLLAALVERLDPSPAREPAPENRALALAVFEKFRDSALANVVRGSLRDPDSRVRARTADVLRELENPYAVAVLYHAAIGRDAELATSARQAIYGLAKTPPPSAEETPSAQSAAFRAWWRGSEAREAKLKAIAMTPAAGDLAPDELLFQFVLDEDAAVWSAAYKALQKLVPLAQGDSKKALWVRALPTFDAGALAPEKREEFLRTMLTWWERRPS